MLTGRLEPVSVTAEERERAEQDVLDFHQRIGSGGEVDLSRIPEHEPPLHGLGFDDRDRLRVRLMPEREGTARFDVYDREGRWRASAVTDFPVPRQRIPVIRGGVFHAVVERPPRPPPRSRPAVSESRETSRRPELPDPARRPVEGIVIRASEPPDAAIPPGGGTATWVCS